MSATETNHHPPIISVTNHGPSFSFIPFVCITEKNVRMSKIIYRMGVHWPAPRFSPLTDMGDERLYLQCSLWVKSGHYTAIGDVRFSPEADICGVQLGMSAMGQQRTFRKTCQLG